MLELVVQPMAIQVGRFILVLILLIVHICSVFPKRSRGSELQSLSSKNSLFFCKTR